MKTILALALAIIITGPAFAADPAITAAKQAIDTDKQKLRLDKQALQAAKAINGGGTQAAKQ